MDLPLGFVQVCSPKSLCCCHWNVKLSPREAFLTEYNYWAIEFAFSLLLRLHQVEVQVQICNPAVGFLAR